MQGPLACLLPMLLVLSAEPGPRGVLISVDGLRTDAITPERAPRMAALRTRGVSATRAVNDLPSVTMTNHATMLTGLHTDRHHVALDFEVPGRLEIPTIFDAMRAAGRRSAYFASKSKMQFLAREDAIERILIGSDTSALTAAALAEITPDGPDFIFVHLRDPDSAGHAHGWQSPMYDEAVTYIDSLVGRIIDALDADPVRQSYLLLTADHGGEGTNHFLNVPANRLVPWIAIGPDLPSGGVLSGEVSLADTMPTLLALLDIEPPAGLDGAVQPLRTASLAASDGSGSFASLGLPCMLVLTPGLWAVWRIVASASERKS